MTLFSKKEIGREVNIRIFYGSGEQTLGHEHLKHNLKNRSMKNIKVKNVLPATGKKIFSGLFISDDELYKSYINFQKKIHNWHGYNQAYKIEGFEWFFSLFQFLTAYNQNETDPDYLYSTNNKLKLPIAYLVKYCWGAVLQESCDITIHLNSKNDLYDFVNKGKLNSYNLMKSIGDVDLYYYFNNSGELLSFTLGNFKKIIKEAEKKVDYKDFI